MPSPSISAALDRLRPFAERARGFSGWTFPDLTVRHLGPPLPWDYEALVRERAQHARSVLDLGTGGGERLAALRPALPGRVIATEAWSVNAPVAFHRLRPLAVDVVRCHSLDLPFRAAAFDLVVNRHEELSPQEVARVLQPGGRTVTQQVARSNWRELRPHFPRMTDFGDQRTEYVRGFAAAGLSVTIDREHEFRTAFGSLGDMVFLLSIAPWVPGFDLDSDIDALLALERACLTKDGLVLTESRYVIAADKPPHVR